MDDQVDKVLVDTSVKTKTVKMGGGGGIVAIV